jgi:hypothetical protein
MTFATEDILSRVTIHALMRRSTQVKMSIWEVRQLKNSSIQKYLGCLRRDTDLFHHPLLRVASYFRSANDMFADALTAPRLRVMRSSRSVPFLLLWGTLWRPLSRLQRRKNVNCVTLVHLIHTLFNNNVSTAEVSVKLGYIIVTDSENGRADKHYPKMSLEKPSRFFTVSFPIFPH